MSRRSNPHVDHHFDPPVAVIGNLRFTRGGVYADYLIDGLPLVLRPLRTHERASRLYRNLARALPSGWSLSGLLDNTDPNRLMRNIVGGYGHRPEWVEHCRKWEPTFNPQVADPDSAVFLEERRRGWLTFPVDSGRAGRTSIGAAERAKDWVAGRDVESDKSVAAYSRLAAEVVALLPSQFSVRPASPLQIQWQHRQTVFRGVYRDPMPPAGFGPDRLTAANFVRPGVDEGANAVRSSWWPTMRPITRLYDLDNPDGPWSYQALLPVTHFPDTGLRFTKAAFLYALDNVDTPARIDWMQHFVTRSPDHAVTLNARSAKNIKDQMRQRGRMTEEDDELDVKLDSTREYNAQIKANPSERELDVATLIAVGAPNLEMCEDAVKQVRYELDQAEIALSRWRGAQSKLWLGFHPGSEKQAYLDEFRDPTSAHLWSRFTPLISTRVGDSRGTPLAENQNTLRRSLILHDPEGCAQRHRNTGLIVIGDPGAGKSNRAKLSAIEVVLRGGDVDMFDPGTHGEWAQAFRNVTDTTVIDLADSKFSLDPLRMFAFDEAGAVAADHILPMIGVPADSDLETRFTLLVSPQMRESEGIGSMRALIRYLRAQPDSNNDMLLARLEAWSTQPGARAIFDESLPPYSPSQSRATVWLTNRLGLPEAQDILNPHLYSKLSKGARAGMAVYGLIIETVQRHQFRRRDRFSTMIFEEAAELMAYPAGAQTAHKITRQGRKHATGIWLISQDYRDFERMGDKFITQKWLFAIRNEELAAKTLEWAGVDGRLYEEVVQSYYEDTSPAESAEDEDSDDEGFGKVHPSRMGEGFIVDERGRRARCRFLGAPTVQMSADIDSTPPQEVRA
ncbi:ATP-binding protein [Mycolicibacterium conceptionense]|uniref:ATP-binding protein n=1 Tax=Mycolicibacterium conceptionense TaxID=451644 RepID=UPI003204C99E